jgi:hypothetical protein
VQNNNAHCTVCFAITVIAESAIIGILALLAPKKHLTRGTIDWIFKSRQLLFVVSFHGDSLALETLKTNLLQELNHLMNHKKSITKSLFKQLKHIINS